MDSRKARGLDIYEKGGQIIKIDESHYRIESQSFNSHYEVSLVRSSWECTCWDFTQGHNCCKHIYAVWFSMSIAEEDKPKSVLEQVKIDTCPYCMSDNTRKKGIRKNDSGNLQKYQCKSCNKHFSTNLGFENMHAAPEAITTAMDIYFAGMSYRKIQRFLKLHGTDVSHVSVYRWVDKYTKIMDGYLKGHRPLVGDKWHADELWIKVRSKQKYLFAMMDAKTRFMLSQEVADSKTKHDARSLLEVGKEIAGKKPLVFVTDGLPSYHDAYKKTFWTHKTPRTEHVSDIHIQNQKRNNNIQERLNGEIRDREKVFRGLKKADSPSVVGMQLYHNYIRPHMGLDGDTPADRAGIIIKGNDKWKTIIQNEALGRKGPAAQAN